MDQHPSQQQLQQQQQQQYYAFQHAVATAATVHPVQVGGTFLLRPSSAPVAPVMLSGGGFPVLESPEHHYYHNNTMAFTRAASFPQHTHHHSRRPPPDVDLYCAIPGVRALVNGMQLLHCAFDDSFLEEDLAHDAIVGEVSAASRGGGGGGGLLRSAASSLSSSPPPVFVPPNRHFGGKLVPVMSFVKYVDAQENLTVMADRGRLELSTVMFPERPGPVAAGEVRSAPPSPAVVGALPPSTFSSVGGDGAPTSLASSHPSRFARIRTPSSVATGLPLPPHIANALKPSFGGLSIVVELLVVPPPQSAAKAAAPSSSSSNAPGQVAGGAGEAPTAPSEKAPPSFPVPATQSIFLGELRLVFDPVIGAFTTGDPSFATIGAVSRYVDFYPSRLALRATFCAASAPEAPPPTTLPASGITPLSSTEPYHRDEAVVITECLAIVADKSLFPNTASTAHTNVHNRIKELKSYERVVLAHCKAKWLGFLASHPTEVLLIKEPGKEIRMVDIRLANTYRKLDEEGARVREAQEASVVDALQRMMTDGDMEYKELLDKMIGLEDFVAMLSPSSVMFDRFLATRKDDFWVQQDPEHTTRVGLVIRSGSRAVDDLL